MTQGPAGNRRDLGYKGTSVAAANSRTTEVVG
jgi:hypothetical protein